jgi:hypothetical protein
MRQRLALLALFVLALGLRVAPIEHGMPRGYVPDGHMVRNALGMAQDKNLIPPAGKYSTYPYLVPYLLLPIYAAEYVGGKALGHWSNSAEFADKLKEQPGVAILPARALMALCGALTCWAVFRAARAAKLTSGAWVAAFLTATSLLNVHLSTHERPWAAVILFGALSAWASIAFVASGRRRELVLAFAAAAGAFACHQAGLVFIALPASVWLSSALGGGIGRVRERLPQALIGLAVFVAVALVIGHPYFLRYGLTPSESVIGGGQQDGVVSIGSQPMRLGISFASAAHLIPKWFGYDPVLLVLGLAGIGFALQRRDLRAMSVATLAIAAFFLFNPNDHVRYMLPASMLLALPAGLLAERLWSSPAARVALPLACALPLVQAVRFDVVMNRTDTRGWFERLLPKDSTIAIDHYGPLPEKSQAALERIEKLRPLYGREAHRKMVFEYNLTPPGGPGLDVIGVEELFGVDPTTLRYGVRDDPKVRALGSTPREVLEKLGVDYFLLVERDPGAEVRPLAELVAGRKPELVIGPTRPGCDDGEAFLPTEMDFPLTALWRVVLPGPKLSLYSLK